MLIREYEVEYSPLQSKTMAVSTMKSTEMELEAFDAVMDEYLIKALPLHDMKRFMGLTWVMEAITTSF